LVQAKIILSLGLAYFIVEQNSLRCWSH